MHRDALEPRPQRNGRQRRHEPGDRPAANALGNRAGRRRYRDGDHEGEQRAGVRYGHVTSENAAERDHEPDDQHQCHGCDR